MKHVIVVTFLFASSASMRAQGTVSGSFADDAGSPLSGLMVEIHSVASPVLATNVSWSSGAVLGPAFASSTTTEEDGSFSFPSVPSGTYYICGWSATPGLMSNCEWQTLYKPINVGAAGFAGAALVMTRGTVITINLHDPSALLNAPAHHFFAGFITSDGYYEVARLAASGTALRTYVATIPNNMTVYVFVDSDLLISDDSGASVPVRQPSNIALSTGAAVAIDLTLQ